MGISIKIGISGQPKAVFYRKGFSDFHKFYLILTDVQRYFFANIA